MSATNAQSPVTVGSTEPAIPHGPQHPQTAISASLEIEALIRMTKDVFGQTPALRKEIDPEGGDEYVVVEVSVKGSADEIFSQTQLWHRRLAREFNEAIPFVLSPMFA